MLRAGHKEAWLVLKVRRQEKFEVELKSEQDPEMIFKKRIQLNLLHQKPKKPYFIEVAACDRLVEGLGFVAQRILWKLIYTNEEFSRAKGTGARL